MQRIERSQPRRGRLRRIGRPGLVRDAVQGEIKRYILTNNLRPGDPLPPEGELARQLGVGRNSVREAVKALEALGILDVRVGQGLAVRDFTLSPVLDAMTYGMLVDLRTFVEAREARQFLELGLVERIIDRVTPGQIEAADGVLADWRGLAERDLYSPERDRAFHEATWQNLNNRFVGSILEAFWDAQARIIERIGVTPPTDLVGHVDAHGRILDAMRARDEAALTEAFRTHYAFYVDRWDAATGSLELPLAGT
jgi:DNA-binding FadR family transcriptional regulator